MLYGKVTINYFFSFDNVERVDSRSDPDIDFPQKSSEIILDAERVRKNLNEFSRQTAK